MKTLEKAGIKTWHKLYIDNSTIEEGNHQRYVYDFFATDEDNDNPTTESVDGTRATDGRSRKSSNQSKTVPPIKASMTSMTSDSKTSDPFDDCEESLKQNSVVLSLTEYLNFEADHFEEVKEGYLFRGFLVAGRSSLRRLSNQHHCSHLRNIVDLFRFQKMKSKEKKITWLVKNGISVHLCSEQCSIHLLTYYMFYLW